MVLIIGGAYQGKLQYALDAYGYGEEDIFDCTGKREIDFSKAIINNFDAFVLGLTQSGQSPKGFVADHMEKLKGKIIIANDISCGVVPIDETTRAWRENTGRTLSLLSQQAEQVVRVFCGIGTVIK